jgi:ABC-2 type transport system permease protein
VAFVLLPLCCVYYPVATLPGWLQPVSLALPPTWVFEGLRALVLNHTFEARYMLYAFLLNLGYFAMGAGAFAYFLHQARMSGSLVQMGE